MASLKETCVYAKLLQLCPALFNPMDFNPPGSFVYGILQERILEWVAFPSPGNLSYPGTEPMSLTSSSLAGRFFTTSTIWEALRSLQARTKYRSSKRPTDMWAILYEMKCKVITQFTQSCPTLCDPMDCGLPGSSAHGILQERILEWVFMHSSGNFPDPGNEPASLMSSTLAGGFFTTGAIWESPHIYTFRYKHDNLQYWGGFEQLTPVCC